MRRLIAGLSLALVVTVADFAEAQPGSPAQPGARRNVNNQFTAGLSYRPEKPRVRRQRTEADLLIYRQAAYQATQRATRIESRKWLGYSPHRPVGRVGLSLFMTEYQPPLAWTGGWYGRADWLWTVDP